MYWRIWTRRDDGEGPTAYQLRALRRRRLGRTFLIASAGASRGWYPWEGMIYQRGQRVDDNQNRIRWNRRLRGSA